MAPEPIKRSAPVTYQSAKKLVVAVGPRGPNSYFLAMVACTLFFLAIGARWVWVYRYGQPYDIDEAGYLSIALGDYYALIGHGVIGWFDQVIAPNIQAPLTTALASLLFYVNGPRPIVAFAVPLVAGALTVIATFFLGRAVGSRPAGLAAAILVASCPLIVIYSRSFSFALPATFVMAFTMLALVLSRRFDRMGWAIVFGVSLGLMPLARTMTLTRQSRNQTGPIDYLLG